MREDSRSLHAQVIFKDNLVDASVLFSLLIHISKAIMFTREDLAYPHLPESSTLDGQAFWKSTWGMTTFDDHGVDGRRSVARSKQLLPLLPSHSVEQRPEANERVGDCLRLLGSKAEGVKADGEEPLD